MMQPVRMPAVWARVRPWPSWAAKRGAAAAGDYAGVETGGDGQGQALAVMGVELFYFESGAVGLREEEHAAVGHGAVDVHEEEFDLGGAFF